MSDPKNQPPGGNGPNDENPSPRFRSPMMWLMVLLLIFSMSTLVSSQRSDKEFSQFRELLNKGTYHRVHIYSDKIEAFKTSELVKPEVYAIPAIDSAFKNDFSQELEVLIKEEKLKSYDFKEDNPFYQFLIHISPILLLFVFFYFLFLRPLRGGGGIGNALSFGKSRVVAIPKGKAGVTFSDVAGIDEAKEEVQEIIEFLKEPEKFQKLGGRIPRGLLLVGPPGTGKTLLAKAIAGEAEVPFFSISGSDFVEMFVGVGASRVRDLFQQAKAKSPCIIFLDEIDAVGRKRGVSVGGGGDEREQTLNAILVEMDGMDTDAEVIVIAATNRADVLDKALLRPGRFDRQVFVDLPDIKGREQILKVHAAKVKLDASADLHSLAVGTPGFSGADLAAIINEAALRAAHNGQETVGSEDLQQSRDKIAFGKKRHSRMKAMTEEDKRVTAYHEAGHAVLSEVLDSVDPVYKVTIIPTGRALGMTMHFPEKDVYHMTRKKLFGQIVVYYGGRIAEEVFCGDISTGAQNDIEMATRIARAMVVEYGMTESLGAINYSSERDEVYGLPSHEHSDELMEKIDGEVRKIIDEAYSEAVRLLDENKKMVEDIAGYLIEYETLDRVDLDRIKNGQAPERKPPADDSDLKGPEALEAEQSPQVETQRPEPGDDLGLTPAL